MKRCPECRRDYHDDTLSYCLADGAELVYGLDSDQQVTAILHEADVAVDNPKRQPIGTTAPTAILPSGAVNSSDRSRRWLFAVASLVGLVAICFFGYRYLSVSPKGAATNSIAVLPFANATGDKDMEFLADGIAETLINNFTKIPDLKVAARSTAFRFRGREDEPQLIGRELGVGSVLTGRVMQRAEQLSVQVDLIDARDGSQIWGNRYEGRTSDLVNIQQRIATDVSSQLKLKLTGAQAQQIAKTYTQNPQAYQHYLRGRYHWNKRTASDLDKARREFQSAADLDPGYAMAWVGLGDTYVVLTEYAGQPTTETLPKARGFIQRALEIDNTLGEAYATLGLISQNSWEWDEADRNFERSIELNPNYPTARHWYAISLRDSGKLDQAQQQISRAYELDPLSPIIGSNVAIMHIVRGEEEKAFAQLNKTLELNPNWYNSYYWLGIANVKFGHKTEAVKSFEKTVELYKSHITLSCLGYAYTAAGREADARRILVELDDMRKKRQASSFYVAAVYSGLGDNDKAFELLEEAYRERDGLLVRVRWFPPFESLRKDARYRDLVQRMNVPE
jgi:TolB-like protein/Flp pilus assembly protein TadD